MKQLAKRIEVLEADGPPILSPAVKAWLGWPLTETEQRALNDGGGFEVSVDIDTSTWSKEVKVWLGVE